MENESLFNMLQSLREELLGIAQSILQASEDGRFSPWEMAQMIPRLMTLVGMVSDMDRPNIEALVEVLSNSTLEMKER